jgi:hypothetical protein
MAAGGGTGIHLDHAQFTKIRKAERRQTRNPPSASADAAARLISFAPPRRRAGRARSPVGVPPRRLRQRTNAAVRLQHALPGTRSGAQPRWFERPCAAARALPAPSCPSPASSSQTGHGAGRAFCRSRPRAAVTSRRPREPHSPAAAGVTRLPSCSRARFATSVPETETIVNENVTRHGSSS